MSDTNGSVFRFEDFFEFEFSFCVDISPRKGFVGCYNLHIVGYIFASYSFAHGGWGC